MKDITENPGVYLLTCRKNGKLYVGEAINLLIRVKRHKSSKNYNKNNQIVHKAIQKYGWENFDVEILREYEKPINKEARILLKIELVALEAAFIDFYDCLAIGGKGYNVLRFGTCHIGHKATNETRLRLSISHKGKNAGEKHYLFGKQMSEEHRKKISKGNKGKCSGEQHWCYGKEVSKETIKRMSDSQKERYSDPIKRAKFAAIMKFQDKSYCEKPVLQIDKNTGYIIKLWKSVSEACRGVAGGNSSDIAAVCMGNGNSAFGFAWKFEKDRPNLKIENNHVSGYPIPRMPKKPMSQEQKTKISNSLRSSDRAKLARSKRIAPPYQKAVKQINKETGEVIKIWESPTIAARTLMGRTVCRQYIYRVCRGLRKNYKGFRWEFA